MKYSETTSTSCCNTLVSLLLLDHSSFFGFCFAFSIQNTALTANTTSPIHRQPDSTLRGELVIELNSAEFNWFEEWKSILRQLFSFYSRSITSAVANRKTNKKVKQTMLIKLLYLNLVIFSFTFFVWFNATFGGEWHICFLKGISPSSFSLPIAYIWLLCISTAITSIRYEYNTHQHWCYQKCIISCQTPSIRYGWNLCSILYSNKYWIVCTLVQTHFISRVPK